MNIQREHPIPTLLPFTHSPSAYHTNPGHHNRHRTSAPNPFISLVACDPCLFAMKPLYLRLVDRMNNLLPAGPQFKSDTSITGTGANQKLTVNESLASITIHALQPETNPLIYALAFVLRSVHFVLIALTLCCIFISFSLGARERNFLLFLLVEIDFKTE